MPSVIEGDGIRPLRGVHAYSPFASLGVPFGNPTNRWLQTRVLREALPLLDSATAPNTIQSRGYRCRQTRDKAAW
jgi:hypothetical protein